MVALGVADVLIGPTFSLLVPYAAVVALVGWLGPPRIAYPLAGLATVSLTAASILAGGSSIPAVALWNGLSALGLFLLLAWLTTTLERRVRNDARFAAMDALTELPNRGSFIARLDAELARASRYGRAFTLVYVDLDHFKAVNDLEGHDAGDELLRRVADALRSSTRQTDFLGRLGGDEFAALLAETTFGPAGAVLDKLQENLAEAMAKGGWPVTFSIGVVTFEAPVETSRDALRVADGAMYTVKRSGRNGAHHLVWDGDTALP